MIAFRYLHKKNKADERAMLKKRKKDQCQYGHHVEVLDTESLRVSLLMNGSRNKEKVKL